MKIVLNFVSKIILGAGMIEAVVLTCLLDSDNILLHNILILYTVAATLIVIGALLSKLAYRYTETKKNNGDMRTFLRAEVL